MEDIKKITADESCSCRGANLDKLIQPSILIILSKYSKMHGYAIVRELEDIESAGVDKAGIYRTLKILEERGHIDSEWQNEDDKPSKKVFSLNRSGYYCLYNWVSTLRNYKIKLDKIIEDGDAALKKITDDGK